METSLYAPVKRFLEGLGFEVKGEVCGCDIVAVDHGSPIALVICELKLSFTLELVLQAADRSTVCDEVWLAVRGSMRGRGRESDPRVKRLCRLLGFGLLCVSRSGRVDALVEPVAWRPRPNAKRRSKILEEHRRRKGDPTPGGAARQPIMTAPARPRDLKPLAPDAPKILLRNVYGWFIKVERGVYALSEAGRAALVSWAADPPGQPANMRGEPEKISARM